MNRPVTEAQLTQALFHRIAKNSKLDPKRWDKWWRAPSKPMSVIAANRERRKQQRASRRRNRR